MQFFNYLRNGIKMLSINGAQFLSHPLSQSKSNIRHEELENTIARCDYFAALNLLLPEILNERSANHYSGPAFMRLNSLCHSNGRDSCLIEALENAGNDADNPEYLIALGMLMDLYSSGKFEYLIKLDHEKAHGYMGQIDSMLAVKTCKALIKDGKYDGVINSSLLWRAEMGDIRASEALDAMCAEIPFKSTKLLNALMNAIDEGPRTVNSLLTNHFNTGVFPSLWHGVIVRLANQVNNKDECRVQALTNLCTAHQLLVGSDSTLASKHDLMIT
jgi:hypothetical protein